MLVSLIIAAVLSVMSIGLGSALSAYTPVPGGGSHDDSGLLANMLKILKS